MNNALIKAGLVLAMLAPCLQVQADEVKDLEEDLSLTIEDATPSQPGSVQFNGIARYQRMRPSTPDAGRNELQLTPRMQFGVARNFQMSVAVPYRVGNAEDTSQGEFRLDGLYRFNTESGYLPAFAVSGGIERPYGADSGGTEVMAKGIMTKSLGVVQDANRPAQLHLNVMARHNLRPDVNERRDRYLAGAALSKQLNQRWLFAGSLFREQQRERGAAYNMGEVGARWKLSEKLMLSGSVGHGFNHGAPPLRMTVGFQRSLD